MNGEFYYKRIKVKGQVYMQIWKRNQEGKDEYLLSLGTASACYLKNKKLVGEDSNPKKD